MYGDGYVHETWRSAQSKSCHFVILGEPNQRLIRLDRPMSSQRATIDLNFVHGALALIMNQIFQSGASATSFLKDYCFNNNRQCKDKKGGGGRKQQNVRMHSRWMPLGSPSDQAKEQAKRVLRIHACGQTRGYVHVDIEAIAKADPAASNIFSCSPWR